MGKIFGSGTRLYVTDNPVRKPKVTVYSASKPDTNGKTTLLCLARDMMPDLVKISWKKKDQNDQTVEVPQGEKEELEQREEGKTTSMIIIDKEKSYSNKYSCSVKHEGGNKNADMPKEVPTEAPPTSMAAPTCPSRIHPQEPVDLEGAEDSFQSMCRLNLASLSYTVMIQKSLVYCYGLTVLLLLRIMGKDTTCCDLYERMPPGTDIR
ncbi:hypothetical protein UPYG_G00299510 [Umbra pygmaea]|uniref:Ig-like domain-containing protein n=1 Tax=Umbra pygmaea TaxID=75934 RepID=A0ABD0W662_UMBPY